MVTGSHRGSLGPRWERMCLSQGVRDQSRTPESQGLHGGRKCQLLSRRRGHLQTTRRATESLLFSGPAWASGPSHGFGQEAQGRLCQSGPGTMPPPRSGAPSLTHQSPVPVPHQRGNSELPRHRVTLHSGQQGCSLGQEGRAKSGAGSRGPTPPMKIFLEQVGVEGSLLFLLTPVSTIAHHMALLGISVPFPTLPFTPVFSLIQPTVFTGGSSGGRVSTVLGTEQCCLCSSECSSECSSARSSECSRECSSAGERPEPRGRRKAFPLGPWGAVRGIGMGCGTEKDLGSGWLQRRQQRWGRLSKASFFPS